MKSSFKHERCICDLSWTWRNFLGILMISCWTINKNVSGIQTEIRDIYEDQNHQSWDDLQLQFLSNIDSEKLHSSKFHVIQATFTGRNDSSYIIHLTKTKGLYHTKRLGLNPNELQNMQCVYSGTLTEISTSSSNETNATSGIVSFSSCHYEHGFEGLILLPNEQYYIKPSSKTLNKVIKRSIPSPSLKPTVPHKALKVNSKKLMVSGGNIDVVLRASPEDLLEAQKAHPQGNGQELLEDKVLNNDNREASKSLSDSGIENEVADNIDEAPVIGITGVDNGDYQPLPLPKILLLSNKANTKAKRQPRKKPSRRVQENTSSSKVKVVEIAVFTDERLYKIWKGRYPQDTTAKMNQYVLAIINNMNALYNQPSMTERISFRLVHLEIEINKPNTLKDQGGHASKYLKSFCGYAAEKNWQGTLWDHALMLTGMNLHAGWSSGTVGIAWFGTMCINGLSCSLIEGSTFGSTFTTSHEIGHSLGMAHDGSGRNSNCPANSYLMSPTTGGGKAEWSKCSMKNMKDFINKGYSGNPAPTCLTQRGSKTGNAISFANIKLPGQQFNANEQCSVACKGCKPYMTNSPPYNDICHRLFCQLKTSAYNSKVRAAHPALEGTSCGRGKLCKMGKCQ